MIILLLMHANHVKICISGREWNNRLMVKEREKYCHYMIFTYSNHAVNLTKSRIPLVILLIVNLIKVFILPRWEKKPNGKNNIIATTITTRIKVNIAVLEHVCVCVCVICARQYLCVDCPKLDLKIRVPCVGKLPHTQR